MSLPEGTICNNENCTNEAWARVYWPGQLTIMCYVHARKARGLAALLGFKLEVVPVPPFCELCGLREGHALACPAFQVRP